VHFEEIVDSFYFEMGVVESVQLPVVVPLAVLFDAPE
jgi:hypothetical protein